MARPEPVSLIIVSRHRPQALMRALAAVAQMDHPCFEVIVIADPAAAALVRKSDLPVKLAIHDKPNIAAARNLGLDQATASVVAFLDDDAVPEPSWLTRLVAPFADPQVVASAGFVRGRSGLAWQWRAAFVDSNAQDHPFDQPERAVFPGTALRAIKTQGTNCAFRRDDLLDIGGFDPAFHFYLEEADVNLRLGARGGLTAVVPDAVVHHGFAPSARRRADRVPLDLRDIGASLAVFQRRHGTTDAAMIRRIADVRAGLLRHMVSGGLEPRDIARLMQGLHDGLAEGRSRALAPLYRRAASALPFTPLPQTGPRPGQIIAGFNRDRPALEARAAAAFSQGRIVTLICLDRGLRPHRLFFTPQGWWEQTGGRFGRSDRDRPGRYVWKRFHDRISAEAKALSHYRPVAAPDP
jgi:O-antigen biosynthesis protein